MNFLVKIGGSLIPDHVKPLCKVITAAADECCVDLIVGGGDIANIIRRYANTLQLSQICTHNMALLSADQQALLLADIGHYTIADSLDQLQNNIDQKVHVIAPNRIFKGNQLVPNVDINLATSDTIAVLIAKELKRDLIVVSDVDGIYDNDPKISCDATLLKQIKASLLKEKTSIDMIAARLIQEHKIKTWVINGAYPDRLTSLLKNQATTGTEILCN